MAEQLNDDIKTTGIEIVFHRKITAMSQEQMHFVKIQKDLAARIKHACVEVTHALRAITGEIAVMNLYQMVLYVKAAKVLDRD